jgi:hypothetical protein
MGTTSHLKQLALACHGFPDTYERFPIAIDRGNLSPIDHGWIGQILVLSGGCSPISRVVVVPSMACTMGTNRGRVARSYFP